MLWLLQVLFLMVAMLMIPDNDDDGQRRWRIAVTQGFSVVSPPHQGTSIARSNLLQHDRPTITTITTCLREQPNNKGDSEEMMNDVGETNTATNNNNNNSDASATSASKTAGSAAAAAAAAAETDILSSPVFLRRKKEVLQKELEVTQAETNAANAEAEAGKAEWSVLLEDLARESAQIQSRMNTQSTQSDSMATIQVVRQMLNVLDTLDRAFGVVRPSTDAEHAMEAEYKSCYARILDTFTQLGVEEVATVGVEFDYEVHQAVLQKPAEGFEEGVVCEEFQKGFKLGDQLIRAAMVAVAA